MMMKQLSTCVLVMELLNEAVLTNLQFNVVLAIIIVQKVVLKTMMLIALSAQQI